MLRVQTKQVRITINARVHGAEFVHFHIDNALHIASFESISGYLTGKSRKLYGLVEYHELLLRLQPAFAVHNLMVLFVLPNQRCKLLTLALNALSRTIKRKL